MDSFTFDKVEFDQIRRILSRFCRCRLGRQLAERIRPSHVLRTVHHWLEQTTQMVQVVRDVGLPPTGMIADIRDAMHRVRSGNQATGEDFAAVAATLEGLGRVRLFLQGLPEDLNHLHEIAQRMGAFDGEVKAIREVVGPDGEVLDTASPRLAALRKSIEQVAQRIHDVIHSYLRDPDVSRLLQNVTVTLHGDRFVLPVKADNRGRLPGVVHRISSSGATVFVEPTASVELNNDLADLKNDERREIQRLLDNLSLRVASRADEIDDTLRRGAQVDLLAAKAQYGYQFDMTCPDITAKGAIDVHQARHPLLIDQAHLARNSGDENVQDIVPIDIRLGSDFDLLLITGSNTGGKTVTLKTVALMVLMAQSGLYIPARRGASLRMFRHVFIDVGDEQSLQQSLSTFGAHVKRINEILSQADRSTLVLLDELGSGTDPDEGGAIGQAILDELRRIGCLGMVTTHLSILKAYAMNHNRVDNASVEFDTRTLRPTYHLHIGTPGESHAITVAGHLGLPKSVTDAARGHLDTRGRQFTKALRATGAARRSAETARADAVSARLAAEDQATNFQNELARLKQTQQDFEQWLAELTDMEPGDPVAVPSLGRSGRLVRLELHRQVAVVDANAIQIEVPLREMMPDFGQGQRRKHMADLRRQAMEQARQTQADADQAKRLRVEYDQALEQLKQRGKQFDLWLQAVAKASVGDVVPVNRAPGKAKLLEVDLPKLRAKIETPEGPVDVRLQDIFPQTGAFAPGKGKPARPAAPRHRKPAPRPDEPLHHRSADSKRARAARKVILSMGAGQEVYVVPFRKRARLVRIIESKEQAVVQSGAFEMTVPLADLDLPRENARPHRHGGGRPHHRRKPSATKRKDPQ